MYITFAVEGGEVTFQPNIWGMLIGVILPIAVGLVTKHTTHPGAKATLLLFLSALNGFLTEFIAAQVSDAGYDMATALWTWGGSFVLAVAVHFGYFKPAGTTDWAQRNMVK
ncbi:hypothetical protein GCM10010423_65020 [Streptomyces levis]|uniref:Integral membrane protein n=1 Tax=Streptomyces levis TaxID=285566 RepID=A0ABN3P2I9_9ACTN